MLLNLFPTMYLALLAYAILRIIVGMTLVYLAINHWRHRQELQSVLRLPWWPWGGLSVWLLFIVELSSGVLFIFGAYTQVAALITLFFAAEMIFWHKTFVHRTLPPTIFYVLLFAVSVSLFITGGGVLAFDLPL